MNELESAREKLKLYEDLVRRLNPCCEDFHHKPSEYHKANEHCPVIEMFKDIFTVGEQ